MFNWIDWVEKTRWLSDMDITGETCDITFVYLFFVLFHIWMHSDYFFLKQVSIHQKYVIISKSKTTEKNIKKK